MSSRVSIQQIVSTSAPAGAALGDEWFNPTTGILSKRTLVNGIVDWVAVITSSGGRVTNTAASISTSSGALTVAGGIGVGGNINFGGSLFQNGVLFTGGGGIASFNSVQTLNTQTGTSYTLVLTDAGVLVNMNSAVGSIVTIPNESLVAFSIGQRVDIGQYGLGPVTISAGAGVTLRTSDLPLLNTQYSIGTLIKIGSNEWQFAGPAISTLGYTGSAGPAGYNGSRGVDGFVGSNGYFGSTGFSGSTGFTGSMGGFSSIQILNTQTGTAYTLVLGDAGQLVNINNPVGTTVTVPPESSVAFIIGQRIDIGQLGLGYVSIIAGSGVTLRSTDLPLLNTQYSIGTLIKIGSNEWTFAAPSISQVGPQGPPGPAGGYSGSVGYTGSASTASGYVGSTGYTGSVGPNGSPTNIVGTTSTYTLIPGYTNKDYTGSINDGYITDIGDLYVWKGTINAGVTPPPTVEYLVVAGGGAGGGGRTGGYGAAGGGAGGLLTASGFAVASGSAITVTVGAGGAGISGDRGYQGNSSEFSTITTTGGGVGGAGFPSNRSGGNGGSGGGQAGAGAVGTGVAGPPRQGYNGGNGDAAAGYSGGGGGGAGGVGGNTPANYTTGGDGGVGVSSSISSTSTYYAGGGGGGTSNAGTGGAGGTGGGGYGSSSGVPGIDGTAFTGGGGGASADASGTGRSGGSGVVIIRYADTYAAASSTTGTVSITTASGYIVYRWTASGSITFPAAVAATAGPGWVLVGNIRGYTGSVGSIPSSSIDALNDVDTSTTPPTFDGQALVWNTSTSQWKPGTAVGGGGGEFSVFMLAGM